MVITIPTEQKESERQDEQQKLFRDEDTGAVTSQEATSKETVYVAALEEKLEDGLSYVAGAGKVKVIITLKAGTEHIVLKDISDSGVSTIEKDAGGGNRTVTESETVESTIYTEGADGAMIPYVSKTLSPQVEGITVICEGGGDAVVRSNITEVVKALFPVDVHKIKVVRMAVTKTNSGKETIER